MRGFMKAKERREEKGPKRELEQKAEWRGRLSGADGSRVFARGTPYTQKSRPGSRETMS